MSFLSGKHLAGKQIEGCFFLIFQSLSSVAISVLFFVMLCTSLLSVSVVFSGHTQ